MHFYLSCERDPQMNETSIPSLVSIVLPAHNEEENVPVIYKAIQKCLSNCNVKIEIIFVDDGSQDGTVKAVHTLQAFDKQVRLIQFTRNFGHQAALLAGLNTAKGQA